MMDIRNFVIIAHIDSGKSTLADRFLEITGTVEPRRMKPQYLDQLELERERGITIKMAPVRMFYPSPSDRSGNYLLNLIDTPGHSDFSYEVSRALAAVEGAILLVDATKGIQAQTLANLRAARRSGLKIIGAVNKTDLRPPRLETNIELTAELLGVPPGEIFRISAKTGEGVAKLLEAVLQKTPPPSARLDRSKLAAPSRALVFDSLYDDHKGIIAFVRVFDGEFRSGDEVFFAASATKLKMKEVGYFAPELKASGSLLSGEIGYFATGLREPTLVKIGDTVIGSQQKGAQGTKQSDPRVFANFILPGYREPQPVVFVSFYPDGRTKFEDLKNTLERLRLTDAALVLSPDKNEALGRGMRVGFLGQLHFEITASRLEREFSLEFLTSFPSVAYKVKENGEMRTVSDTQDFPDNPDQVFEPMIKLEILAPATDLNQIAGLKNAFRLEMGEVKTMGSDALIKARLPLPELFRGFDDRLKAVSSGFASFNYEADGESPVKVAKMEILIAGEVVPALTRIVLLEEAEREARATLDRLQEILPKRQFAQALQARFRGRIIARENITALRKDVTGYLYGGDRTRKMKLWRKQKKGKEKLEKMAKINIPAEVFREILRK